MPPPPQHSGSSTAAGPPAPSPPAEPSFAERARTLVHLGRIGTLSTNSRRSPGFPFGSVAPYGVHSRGCPTFLLSKLALHTQNLQADPRASLLVTQAGWSEDPLAVARLTLVGAVTPLPASDRAAVRADYLARHAGARNWVDFADFGFYCMDVVSLYYVAGFGVMGWIEPEEYLRATPDPLADSAAAILEHMNAEHGEALVLYCRAFTGVGADAATMTAVDRLGFRVRARTGDQLHSLRINFPREVCTPDDARAVLVDMVGHARSLVAASGSS